MSTRRDFLRGGLAVGGLAALGGLPPLARLARAQQQPDVPDRYYVFAYFGGGWDILLSLDPRDPQRFHDGNLRQTLIQPGYNRVTGMDTPLVRLGDHWFGRWVGELGRHWERLAVVRGMTMETLTHEVGRRRFITGKPPAGLQARGSSSATWLAGQLGAEEPIPNLSLQVETYNTDQPNFATGLRVSSVDDLLRALRPSGPQLSPRLDRQLDALLVEAADCTRATDSNVWQAAEDARLKAREMAGGALAERFDFRTNAPEIAALRDHFGFRASDNAGVPGVQAALAAQALIGGVSRCVSIQVASGLDTHYDDWEDDQGPRQMAGFDAIARLADHLAATDYKGTGQSWLDHTTIVGFSEFSRTPLINDRGGRDHALTNACFLLGGGIRGAQVIGRSSDVGMTPTNIDLRTGLPNPEGEAPRPEHIWQTLFSEVGIGDAPDLRVTPIEPLLRG
jgi:hypothetical protein